MKLLPEDYTGFTALILGSGGAAKAVRFILDKLKIDAKVVSRTVANGDLTYNMIDASVIQRKTLIVNTTPLGTHPKTDAAPDIPYSLLSDSSYLFDLVYNPSVTKYMQLGMNNGAKVMNGYEMLVLQAEKSWEIWNREKTLKKQK